MKHLRGLQIFRDLHTPLVHLVGDNSKARVEREDHKPVPDHIWISVDPGVSLRVIISVNTFSLRNGQAGFDPRVRVGIIADTWVKLPERGINECHRFSYDDIPGITAVEFRTVEKVFLEQMILDRVHQSVLLEAWGSPYQRESPGIHQIHSRKASCAVQESVDGRDGALRFFFQEQKRTETFLFKFCGQ